MNAPIVVDEIALRASAFYSRDGGYFDNLALGKDDVNQADISRSEPILSRSSPREYAKSS